MTDKLINQRFETYVIDLETQAGQEIRNAISEIRRSHNVRQPEGTPGSDSFRIIQITGAMEIQDPTECLAQIQEILCQRNDTRWVLKKAG